MTKGERSGKIGKLSGRQIYRRAKKKRAPSLKNPRKKVKKTFEKGIDKGKEVWYNNKAVRSKAGSERSLKIEQQEISTKQKSKCKSRR